MYLALANKSREVVFTSREVVFLCTNSAPHPQIFSLKFQFTLPEPGTNEQGFLKFETDKFKGLLFRLPHDILQLSLESVFGFLQ